MRSYITPSQSSERDQTIDEASQLISKLTGKACKDLNLYPVDHGGYYAILERAGCVRAAKYYAFNVEFHDVDLPKLRELVKKGVTVESLWDEAEAAQLNAPKEKIKLSFHLGYGTEVNTISIWHISTMRLLQDLATLSKQYLIANAIGYDESTKPHCIGDHVLTIYLPHQSYSNPDHLFQNPGYFSWKQSLISKLPYLRDEFIRFENETLECETRATDSRRYQEKEKVRKMISGHPNPVQGMGLLDGDLYIDFCYQYFRSDYTNIKLKKLVEELNYSTEQYPLPSTTPFLAAGTVLRVKIAKGEVQDETESYKKFKNYLKELDLKSFKMFVDFEKQFQFQDRQVASKKS